MTCTTLLFYIGWDSLWHSLSPTDSYLTPIYALTKRPSWYRNFTMMAGPTFLRYFPSLLFLFLRLAFVNGECNGQSIISQAAPGATLSYKQVCRHSQVKLDFLLTFLWHRREYARRHQVYVLLAVTCISPALSSTAPEVLWATMQACSSGILVYWSFSFPTTRELMIERI